jgi:dTDP-4-dehydrorhamnose 3,5-epimerase
MKFKELNIKGVYEIIMKPMKDERGFFMRTYDENIFYENGIMNNWVQENHSHNTQKNTLRGLHFYLPPKTESKLIRCIKGKILDVFVDLRIDSETFGKWDSVILTEEDNKYLLIPEGFAHGFLTLEDNTDILYKHNNYYDKEYDSGIIWNDETLNVNWGCNNPVLSEKDKKLMTFKEFINKFGGL